MILMAQCRLCKHMHKGVFENVNIYPMWKVDQNIY